MHFPSMKNVDHQKAGKGEGSFTKFPLVSLLLFLIVSNTARAAQDDETVFPIEILPAFSADRLSYSPALGGLLAFASKSPLTNKSFFLNVSSNITRNELAAVLDDIEPGAFMAPPSNGISIWLLSLRTKRLYHLLGPMPRLNYFEARLCSPRDEDSGRLWKHPLETDGGPIEAPTTPLERSNHTLVGNTSNYRISLVSSLQLLLTVRPPSSSSSASGSPSTTTTSPATQPPPPTTTSSSSNQGASSTPPSSPSAPLVGPDPSLIDGELLSAAILFSDGMPASRTMLAFLDVHAVKRLTDPRIVSLRQTRLNASMFPLLYSKEIQVNYDVTFEPPMVKTLQRASGSFCSYEQTMVVPSEGYSWPAPGVPMPPAGSAAFRASTGQLFVLVPRGVFLINTLTTPMVFPASAGGSSVTIPPGRLINFFGRFLSDSTPFNESEMWIADPVTADVPASEARTRGNERLIIDDDNNHLYVSESTIGTVRRITIDTRVARVVAGRGLGRLPKPTDCTVGSPCLATQELTLIFPRALARGTTASGKQYLYVIDFAFGIVVRVNLALGTAAVIYGVYPREFPITVFPGPGGVSHAFKSESAQSTLGSVSALAFGPSKDIAVASDAVYFATARVIVKIPLDEEGNFTALAPPRLPPTAFCNVEQDCNNHAAYAYGIRAFGCTCVCSRNWLGAACQQRRFTASATIELPAPSKPPTVAIPVAVGETATTSVTTGVVLTSVLTTNPVTAVQASRGNFLLSLTYCEPTFDDVGWPDNFLMQSVRMPQVEDDSPILQYAGGALYNFVAFFAFVIIHVLLVAWMQCRYREADLTHVMAYLKFPSLQAILVFLILQGTTKSAVLLLRADTREDGLVTWKGNLNSYHATVKADVIRAREGTVRTMRWLGAWTIIWTVSLIIALFIFLTKFLKARYVAENEKHTTNGTNKEQVAIRERIPGAEGVNSDRGSDVRLTPMLNAAAAVGPSQVPPLPGTTGGGPSQATPPSSSASCVDRMLATPISCKEKISELLREEGHWVDLTQETHHVGQLSGWFAGYKDGRQLFGVAELVLAFVSGGIDGARTVDNCVVTISVTFVAYMLFMLATLYYRPHLSKLNRFVACITAVMQFLSAGVLLYSHVTQDFRVLQVSNSLAVAGMFFVTIGAIFETVAAIISIGARLKATGSGSGALGAFNSGMVAQLKQRRKIPMITVEGDDDDSPSDREMRLLQREQRHSSSSSGGPERLQPLAAYAGPRNSNNNMPRHSSQDSVPTSSSGPSVIKHSSSSSTLASGPDNSSFPRTRSHEALDVARFLDAGLHHRRTPSMTRSPLPVMGQAQRSALANDSFFGPGPQRQLSDVVDDMLATPNTTSSSDQTAGRTGRPPRAPRVRGHHDDLRDELEVALNRSFARGGGGGVGVGTTTLAVPNDSFSAVAVAAAAAVGGGVYSPTGGGQLLNRSFTKQRRQNTDSSIDTSNDSFAARRRGSDTF